MKMNAKTKRRLGLISAIFSLWWYHCSPYLLLDPLVGRAFCDAFPLLFLALWICPMLVCIASTIILFEGASKQEDLARASE